MPLIIIDPRCCCRRRDTSKLPRDRAVLFRWSVIRKDPCPSICGDLQVSVRAPSSFVEKNSNDPRARVSASEILCGRPQKNAQHASDILSFPPHSPAVIAARPVVPHSFVLRFRFIISLRALILLFCDLISFFVLHLSAPNLAVRSLIA